MSQPPRQPPQEPRCESCAGRGYNRDAVVRRHPISGRLYGDGIQAVMCRWCNGTGRRKPNEGDWR
jgi:hypothetical protein